MKRIFRRVSAGDIPIFKSKACAFSFGLSKLMQEGKDLLTASEGAVTFATQQAQMLGLPDNAVAQKAGFEGWLQNIGAMMEFVEVSSKKYPTAVELAKPLVQGMVSTAIGGLFGVKAAEMSQNRDVVENQEPIAYADETPVIEENVEFPNVE